VDLYGWLSVVAILASILASAATIWTHLRINRIQRSQHFSTSGSNSPITEQDTAIQQFSINSGGGDVTVYTGGNS
jgi:hypothetical protein